MNKKQPLPNVVDYYLNGELIDQDKIFWSAILLHYCSDYRRTVHDNVAVLFIYRC